jgi:hypothetical protein
LDAGGTVGTGNPPLQGPLYTQTMRVTGTDDQIATTAVSAGARLHVHGARKLVLKLVGVPAASHWRTAWNCRKCLSEASVVLSRRVKDCHIID